LVSQPLLLNYSHNTCNLNSARSFNLACLFEVGQEAYCTICKFQFTRFNLQGLTYKNSTNKVQLTRFYEQGSTNKNDLQASELLQPYFKSRKGISQTSLRRGILNKIRRRFFFLRFVQRKKTRKLLPASYVQEQFFNVSSTKNSFLVHTQLSQETCLIKVLAPTPLFLQGSHMQKQYQKRTTLCSESSTIKGLLYAPDPEKCKKGTLSDQPRLSRVTSTALLCRWGRSRSKI
jgi:hypothetical protein